MSTQMTKYFIITLILLMGCRPDSKTNKKSDMSLNQSLIERFDTTKITDSDKIILNEFSNRRETCNGYIQTKKLNLFTCPGCGYPTLSRRDSYEICVVCFWEDDGQDDEDALKIKGGPNSELSLIENRINFGHSFHKLADSIGGIIVTDPEEIMNALNIHSERMKKWDDEKLLHVDVNDPLWKEWENDSKKVLIELIK